MKPRKTGKKRAGRGSRDRNGFFSEEKRARYLEGIKRIDFKDAELLKKFMTEQGKIMPRRLTGVAAKQQRQLTAAIRQARILGLVR